MSNTHRPTHTYHIRNVQKHGRRQKGHSCVHMLKRTIMTTSDAINVEHVVVCMLKRQTMHVIYGVACAHMRVSATCEWMHLSTVFVSVRACVGCWTNRSAVTSVFVVVIVVARSSDNMCKLEATDVMSFDETKRKRRRRRRLQRRWRLAVA